MTREELRQAARELLGKAFTAAAVDLPQPYVVQAAVAILVTPEPKREEDAVT